MEIIFENCEKTFFLKMFWINRNKTIIWESDKFIKNDTKTIFKNNDFYKGLYHIGLFDGIVNKIETHISQPIPITVRLYFENTFTEVTSCNPQQGLYFSIDFVNTPILNIVEPQLFTKEKQAIKKKQLRSNIIYWNNLWYNLHYLGYKFPENPSETDFQQIRDFMEILSKTGLPCRICAHHLRIWLTNNNDEHLQTRDDLKHYFWELHNDVNKRNKKKVYLFQEAMDILEKNIFTNMKHFGANIMDFFTEGKLKDFPHVYKTKGRQDIFKILDLYQDDVEIAKKILV